MTVRRSTRAYSWKIMPTRRRTRRNAAPRSDVISCSPSRMRPPVAGTRPLTQRMRDDLPAPEGPIRPMISPRATDSETPRRAESPVL
jgi:hypothetical protein